MNEVGINVASHKAVQATAQAIRNSKLVLTMTEAQKQKLLKIAPVAKNIRTLIDYSQNKQCDIADAYGKDIPFYRATRNQIFYNINLIYTYNWNCRQP